MRTLPLTGNEACAEAMRQINPDVAAVYPITPQTELMHKFADFHADGKVDTDLILVESEHSAMSACVGASEAGARVMTATSSNGLALMWEVLYIASGTRLPIVMPLVNRALSGPLNIHCDHSDAMGARDSGWIQLFCENSQQAYDNTIQAVKIAENSDVMLPVMICFDGFIISHTTERVDVLEDDEVKNFIGDYVPEYPLLDTDNPVTYGPLALPNYYQEFKKQQSDATKNAPRVILDVGKEYGKLSGREYAEFDKYLLEDAEHVIVCLGSTAGTAKAAADTMRQRGVKAGVLMIRIFRPFPDVALVQALKSAKSVAVMDRADSFNGIGGPLGSDVRAALYGSCSIPVSNYIYGLGGRDIDVDEIEQVFSDLAEGKHFDRASYIGVRE